MDLPNPKDHGWTWNDVKNSMVPIWFTGNQLPTSLMKQSRRRQKKRTGATDDEGKQFQCIHFYFIFFAINKQKLDDPKVYLMSA